MVSALGVETREDDRGFSYGKHKKLVAIEQSLRVCNNSKNIEAIERGDD